MLYSKILAKRFHIRPIMKLSITRGKIYFVSFVYEKGYINVLNKGFYINKTLSVEYVWARTQSKHF